MLIDGSYGEGGGQILRTALSLSLLTGREARVERIRAGRRKPGLQTQHLAAVRAAAAIGQAETEGGSLGSQTLSFAPGQVTPGSYAFDVAEERGSAGAATLVAQTLLLPLALASHGQSTITIRGGTHVPWSPPYQHLEHVYLPMLARLGIAATASIERWGFYPVGGGQITVRVSGGQRPQAVDFLERGRLVSVHGVSAVGNLPMHIAERQARRAEAVLKGRGLSPRIRVLSAPCQGQGTAIVLWTEFEHVVCGFSALGERGKPAERVAEEACAELLAHLDSDTGLDPRLADQAVLPLALAGGGRFTTSRITQHLLTNCWLIAQFLPVRFAIEGSEGEPGRVEIRS